MIEDSQSPKYVAEIVHEEPKFPSITERLMQKLVDDWLTEHGDIQRGEWGRWEPVFTPEEPLSEAVCAAIDRKVWTRRFNRALSISF